MQDFRNLEVWSRAHKLTLRIYALTERFPRSEMFGLSSELRRAAASVPTNLAEGHGRTQAEFGRFVQISFGSACEVEYQLLLARDLGYLVPDEYQAVIDEVMRLKRMLSALINRLQTSIAGSKKTQSANARVSTAML